MKRVVFKLPTLPCHRIFNFLLFPKNFTHRISIIQIPRYLTLNLKRVKYDVALSCLVKIRSGFAPFETGLANRSFSETRSSSRCYRGVAPKPTRNPFDTVCIRACVIARYFSFPRLAEITEISRGRGRDCRLGVMNRPVGKETVGNFSRNDSGRLSFEILGSILLRNYFFV